MIVDGNEIIEKQLSIEKETRIAYEFLIIQHAALTCILEQKYERLYL